MPNETEIENLRKRINALESNIGNDSRLPGIKERELREKKYDSVINTLHTIGGYIFTMGLGSGD